jgi:hypothetical protein
MMGVLFGPGAGVVVVEPDPEPEPEPASGIDVPELGSLPFGPVLSGEEPVTVRSVGVLTDGVIVGVGVVCVLEKIDASMTNWGTSRIEMMDAVSKHLYMKRSGEPVHMYVPQAGSVSCWLRHR